MENEREEKITRPADTAPDPAGEESKPADSGSAPASEEPEEKVISVWYGSGNTKWFRRRWFEGYTQYETLEPNGKTVLHHVYTGYWYTQELDQRGRWLHRAAYIAIGLAGIALLLFGSTRVVAANMHWQGGVPAFVGLMGFCWALYGVVNDFIVPQKRTIGDYRSTSLSIIRGSLTSAIASGVLMLVTIIYTIIVREKTGLHLLSAAAELVAGGLALLAFLVEKKVTYTKTQSELAGKYTM